jgi:primosomal protein N' (replication factor Y)
MDHATRETNSSTSATRVVDVLVPVALNQNYSYRVPRGMALKPGDVVCVPLGAREVVAVVWAENANPDPRLHNRLKDVGEKLDVPPLKEELRSLVDWVANYTLSARGMCCAWPCGWAKISGPSGCALACGWWASRHGA